MDGRFEDMLKFGITLKLSGPNEDKYYTQRLAHFIRGKDDFDAETENDEEISIYIKSELSLLVKIEDSVLTFNPIENSSYDGIMVVLEFVANMHQSVQEDYLRDGEIQNEFSHPDVSESSEDEESDDTEWV